MGTILVYTLILSDLFVSAGGVGCPDDWVQFQNSCYVFIDEYVPWTSAKAFCDMLGAKMLEVESSEENDFISAEIRKLNGFQSAWMGLTDVVREGVWRWNSNQEVPEFTNWPSYQPDNSHRHENGEDCVQILPDGAWNDLWCENFLDGAQYKPSPVCEKDVEVETVIG